MADDAIEARSGGVRLRVRVTPRASRDAITGPVETPHGAALGVRVRAVPEGGKANAAVAACLARALGLAPSRVRVVAGGAGRIKRVEIEDAGADLAARVRALFGDAPQRKDP